MSINPRNKLEEKLSLFNLNQKLDKAIESSNQVEGELRRKIKALEDVPKPRAVTLEDLINQRGIDKQVVRDFLNEIDWRPRTPWLVGMCLMIFVIYLVFATIVIRSKLDHTMRVPASATVTVKPESPTEELPDHMILMDNSLIVTNTGQKKCWIQFDGKGDGDFLPPDGHYVQETFPTTIRDGCPGDLIFERDGKMLHPTPEKGHRSNVEVVTIP